MPFSFATYRTELCWNGTSCKHRRNHDCWFAHSPEELRCKDFARHGRCTKENCPRVHYGDMTEEVIAKSWGVPPPIDKPRYARKLGRCEMPKRLHCLIPASPHDVPDQRVQLVRIGSEMIRASRGIFQKLVMMQFVEDCNNQIDLRGYTVQGRRITRTPHRDTYEIPVPGLAENRPSVLRGDRLILRDEKTRKGYGGFVHFVNLDTVTVSLPQGCTGDSYYSVVFMLSPTQEWIRHRALSDETLLLDKERCLQQSTLQIRGDRTAVRHPTRLNDDQKEFVSRVARAKGSTLALLWGPPGTGKTTTLVAAVMEVLASTPPSYRVLVVTPSNDAADLVTERFLQEPYKDILCGAGDASLLFRFNAAGRTASKVSPSILLHSLRSRDGGFQYPTLGMLDNFRVVVATMSTSNQLYSLGVKDDFFKLLFVDEAGHATEADLMLALQVAPKAQRIVLAGDHKQLGPVVRSHACIANGMDISPLQRLQEVPELQRLSVMLKRNYRSDPRIVCLVNAAYKDQLAPQRQQQALPPAREAMRVTFLDRQYKLPLKDHAIVFIHHSEPESRERDSPSWQNKSEAHLCVDMAHELERVHGVALRDVMVLSPYRRQVVRIGQIVYGKYRHNPHHVRNGRVVPPLEASTLEMFQGRERRVVILSCVRNNPEEVNNDVRLSLGFVRQPQRANVAVSRARDVLMVVGNLALLGTDDVWAEYIQRAVIYGVLWDLSIPPQRDGTPQTWTWRGKTAPPRGPMRNGNRARDDIEEEEGNLGDMERPMIRDT